MPRKIDAEFGWAGQARHWVTAASDEEYDYALAHYPHLCRPFAAAIGDRRPARQVLADGRADAAETIAALASTPDGRRRLTALAAAIEERLRGGAAGGSGAGGRSL